MIILVIPVTICLVIAAKVGSMIGYARSIRIFAYVYFLTPLLSFFNFHFVTFMLCNLLLPCSAFSLAIVPIFHCMYSHFGHSKSLATGAVICSFGIGAIVWNLVATITINPENVVPDIQTPDPSLNFFPQ
jgi:hypothetical protein